MLSLTGESVNRHPRDAIHSLSMTAPHGHRQRRQGPVCGLAQNGLSLSGQDHPAGDRNAVSGAKLRPAGWASASSLRHPNHNSPDDSDRARTVLRDVTDMCVLAPVHYRARRGQTRRVIVLDTNGKSAASSDGCGDTDTRNAKNGKAHVTRKTVRIALSRPGRGPDSGSNSIRKSLAQRRRLTMLSRSRTVIAAALVIGFIAPAMAQQPMRHYLAYFKYTDAAVKAMTENPQDREAAVPEN